MKILFILPEYYPHSGGGISTYYINYITALRHHCSEVKVMVGSGYVQDNNVFKQDGVTVEYLKPDIYNYYLSQFTQYDLLPEFKKNIAAAWAIWEQANKGEGYDIIECTDFALGFIPWIINHHKPVITRLHGSMGQISLNDDSLSNDISNLFIKQTELSLLPLCDELISHSKANQSFWNDVFKSKQVIHINPVYETTIALPLPLSQRDGDGLVTARIQKWKGPIELCKACVLLDSPPLIKWIGRDMLFTEKQGMSNYLKNAFPAVWGKSVIPLSPQPNEEIRLLQQKTKYGVIPSTWDMFNFTGVEFMAAGTPVICSDGAGVSGLIEHGKNGFKYHSNDIQALADCIKEINGLDEQTYNTIATAAIETIKAHLSANHLIPLNLQLYKTVLSNFKATAANVISGSVYEPSDKKNDIADILNKQPLKKLSKYYIKRLRSKLWGK